MPISNVLGLLPPLDIFGVNSAESILAIDPGLVILIGVRARKFSKPFSSGFPVSSTALNSVKHSFRKEIPSVAR
jgi:hypothetical protein